MILTECLTQKKKVLVEMPAESKNRTKMSILEDDKGQKVRMIQSESN